MSVDLSAFILPFNCSVHLPIHTCSGSLQVKANGPCVCYDVQVAEELQSGPMSTEEKELLHLLTSPHLKVNTQEEEKMERWCTCM